MSQAPEIRIDRIDPPPRHGTVLLELAGELDLAVSPRFHALVDEVVTEAPEMVVADVSGVGFMDSTMLRDLLRAHRALAEAGSRLVVAGAQAPVQRLLELTGTNEVFVLAGSREAALAG